MLQEERDYTVPEDTSDGEVTFLQVDGSLVDLAQAVFDGIIPELRSSGIPLSKIAVLYKTAIQGDYVANVAAQNAIDVLRADNNALVRRNNPVSRFVEACAAWVSGGWRTADPPFARLSREAAILVLPVGAAASDRLRIEQDLIAFLESTRSYTESTNSWLVRFQRNVLQQWRQSINGSTDDWDVVDEMLRRTSPSNGFDISVAEFCGRSTEDGRLNLSTLHSSKGREFNAVVMFAMNADLIPDWRDRTPQQVREARRLFYVGVTRAEERLYFVCRQGQESRFVKEFRERLPTSPA